MKKILIVTFLIAVFFTACFAKNNEYSDYIIVNKYNEAIRIAEFTEKPLMIMFSVATCQDCVDFKDKTLMQQEVIQFLKERFVMVDINPYPHLKGVYPIGTDIEEEYSYSLLFRKFGIKRTPSIVFLDEKFNVVNRTTGFYDSEQFIHTVKDFDKMYEYVVLSNLKIIDKEMALMILNTIPNSQLLDFSEFETAYKSLDTLDYFILENTDFYKVQQFLKDRDTDFKNIYVYEGELEYTRKDAEISEVKTRTAKIEGWTNVNKEQVKAILEEEKENEEFFIIDVRTPEEYALGNLENSINIDFFSEDFKEQLNNYDKADTYLVYCQSGGRSSQAVRILNEMGFESIYHYEDGYSDWLGN